MQDQTTVEDFIDELCDLLNVPSGRLSQDTIFQELETWDSMEIMNVMVFLDEHYGVDLTHNDLAEIQCVRDLVQVLRRAQRIAH